MVFLRYKPDPHLLLFRPFPDSPLLAKVNTMLCLSLHYLTFRPHQRFCPPTPLLTTCSLSSPSTQSHPRITSTRKLLDIPSYPPLPPSHLHPAPQGRVGAPLMYPLPSGPTAQLPAGLPPFQAVGSPKGGDPGLLTQHGAWSGRDPGNPENGQGGRRCLPAASLSHDTLKPWDQVQLCPAFPSLPEEQSPGPAAITLPLTLSIPSLFAPPSGALPG